MCILKYSLKIEHLNQFNLYKKKSQSTEYK